jgi:two-component system, OmpR family, response regulator CpxR
VSVDRHPPDTNGSILLISDNLDLSLTIQNAFTPGGFTLLCESHVERGLRGALDGEHCLVFVDAAISGVEVLELVRGLRSRSAIPLIVISPLTERGDLIAILESGADDFIGGAIAPDEVVARARAVLRRGRCRRHLPGESLAVGSIRITPASRLVRVDGNTIDLTSVEYDILEYLARQAGTAVSRDELTEAVCRRAPSPLDRSLDVHISHMRRKLQQHGAQILTIRGVGYMLAAAGAAAASGPSR